MNVFAMTVTNELSNMLLKRLGLMDLLSCHHVQNEFLTLNVFFTPIWHCDSILGMNRVKKFVFHFDYPLIFMSQKHKRKPKTN